MNSSWNKKPYSWIDGALSSLIALVLAAAGSPAQAAEPQVFAPGVISGPANEASPAFTPDGKTVFFTRGNSSDYDILVSHRTAKGWSEPKLASFSGQWRDLEATMAPDGSYLIFASSRPLPGTTTSPDGFWGGSNHPGKGGNLWRVNRTKSGWGEPGRLPDTVNRTTSTFSPSITADGTLYFMEVYGDSKRFHLFRSALKDGVYQAPEPMPFADEQWSDVDPAVAPDESFMIFSSTRPPTPPQQQDLFIVFRKDGHWGTPVHLPDAINRLSPSIEARLGADGHTLYFTSSYVVPAPIPKDAAATRQGLKDMQTWNTSAGNIWEVDIADIIKAGDTTP